MKIYLYPFLGTKIFPLLIQLPWKAVRIMVHSKPLKLQRLQQELEHFSPNILECHATIINSRQYDNTLHTLKERERERGRDSWVLWCKTNTEMCVWSHHINPIEILRSKTYPEWCVYKGNMGCDNTGVSLCILGVGFYLLNQVLSLGNVENVG